MSMIVKTAIKGVIDLELLLEALRAMELTAARVESPDITFRGKRVLARVIVADRYIGIVRNEINRQLELVGDQDWKIMKDKSFTGRIRQQYGVAAVKQKAEAMQYQIASINTAEDGAIRIIARAWG